MRTRRWMSATVSVAMSGVFLVGVAQPASAACATTAVANDWGTNCTTYWLSNKVSRYTLAIQYILKHRGYYAGSIDGDYGPATQSAVIAYQSAFGLSADGIVGPNTWKSLRARLVNQRASECSGQTTWDMNATGGGSGVIRRSNSTLVYNVLQLGQGSNSCTNHYTMSTAAP